MKSDLKMPFKSSLSLKHINEFWEKYFSDDENYFTSKMTEVMKGYIQEHPELLQDRIEKKALLKHEELLQMILTKFSNGNFKNKELTAIIAPMEFDVIIQTPDFKDLFEGEYVISENFDGVSFDYLKPQFSHAYVYILNKFYNLELDLQLPMFKYITNKKNNLTRCYRLELNLNFVDIIALDKLPELKTEEINRLIENLYDEEYIMKVLPPELFEFNGIVILNAVDVTDQQLLSLIKHELIDNSVLQGDGHFEIIQQMIRSLLNREEIEIGLAGIDGEKIFFMNHGGHYDEEKCIYENSDHISFDQIKGSPFMESYDKKQTVVVSDITTKENPVDIEKMLIAKGIRNIVSSPLIYDSEIIGNLFIASKIPCSLCSVDRYKIEELRPLFAAAMKRTMEEFKNKVQLMIQNQFTAIHPAVEWKFQEAVLKFIDSKIHNSDADSTTVVSEIVFHNVYPLFAVSDIRGSSTHRNSAIQSDIRKHLSVIKDILHKIYQDNSLPIIDEMIYKIDVKQNKIENEISSGDELEIISFITKEIEPFFDYINELENSENDLIKKYYNIKDSEHGTIYEKRKMFDDSVSKINRVISSYLNMVQEDAQKTFPHYFEKQATDGVDFSIYIGGELTREKVFNQIYLRNLRLWQIMVLCNIANITSNIKNELPVPLDLTHLIVVQDMPISISFNTDEKRFVVDGAYNIRYEIIKKRIDKAVIKNTGERLTQPGKLAIVYSQQREADEYIEYLDYLKSKGYLSGEIESHKLDDLQGIHGLKALRIDIETSPDLLNVDLKKFIKSAVEYIIEKK